jgi:hypothetical protein
VKNAIGTGPQFLSTAAKREHVEWKVPACDATATTSHGESLRGTNGRSEQTQSAGVTEHCCQPRPVEWATKRSGETGHQGAASQQADPFSSLSANISMFATRRIIYP